jgi:tetratricopeptide (TPR) repeat protein
MHTALAALLAFFSVLASDSPGDPWAAGSYRSAELGLLEFTSESRRVSGKFQAGGGCAEFQPGQQIIEGQFEGNVLVGTVMLCQSGPACRQQVYPFLAFYQPSNQSLSSEIKLEPGCSSAGLNGSLLLLGFSPDDPPGSKAPKKRNRKNLELHKTALFAGSRLLEAGDYSGAAQQFEVAVSYNDSNWTAYLGLGVAEFKRGNVLKAIELYQRARDLAHEARQDNPDIYYDLACAHSRRGDRKAALANLRQALKLGFALPEQMSSDPDLNKLFRDDPEFKKLLKEAWAQKGTRRGERRP